MWPLLLIWLHILAAISWIGGMIFLSLVLAPLVRSRHSTSEVVALFRSAARRFRLIVWVAITVLVTTGPLLLLQRNAMSTNPSAWPQILVVKLELVALLLVLTLSHDLLLGPKVSQLGVIPDVALTTWEKMLIRTARWLPRLSLLLALAVVAAAVVLART
jgi:copper resistance protein D